MTNPLIAALFAYGELSRAQQDLVTDQLPQYQPDLARNRAITLEPDLWRTLYRRTCPIKQATALLGQPTVRPEDIAWVLTDRTERRAGALRVITANWHLPTELAGQLASGSTSNAGLRDTLTSPRGLVHPDVQLAAAANGSISDVTWCAARNSPFLTDEQLLTALHAAAGRNEGSAPVRKVAELAQLRPGIRAELAQSGHVMLAAAAAQCALDPHAQQAALHTLATALDNQDDSAAYAITGLAGLLFRHDTNLSVRDAALEVADRHPKLADQLQRHRIPGRVNPFPTGTATADLTGEQVDLLLTKAPLAAADIPAGRNEWLDLATRAVLTDDQAERLLANSRTDDEAELHASAALHTRLGRQVPGFAAGNLEALRTYRAELARALNEDGMPRRRDTPPPAPRTFPEEWEQRCSECTDVPDWTVSVHGIHRDGRATLAWGYSRTITGELAVVEENEPEYLAAARWLLAQLGTSPDAIVTVDKLLAGGLVATLSELTMAIGVLVPA